MEVENNKDLLYEDYKQKRQEFITQSKSHLFTEISFSKNEQKADDIWAKMLQADRHGRKHLFYQYHTLTYRDQYQETDIFKVIAQMPKGAALHTHSECSVDNEWFLKEIAYNGSCYFNQETGFFKYYPLNQQQNIEQGFKNCQTISKELGKEACDTLILKTLNVQPEEARDFSIDIWTAFQKKIICTSGYFCHKENHRQYLKHVFTNYINEGTSRLEARRFQGWLKEQNSQNPISWEEEYTMIQELVKEVQQEHPQFSYGVILQGLKVWDKEQIMKWYRTCFEIKKKFPQLILGFDMVAEEDAFKTTLTLAEVFVYKEQLEKEFGVELPFFLHGGESIDAQLNDNLYDCLLLKSKRIGHGINLIQHSHLIEDVKKNNICLELCPASNQVLRYYPDIRSHPLRSFLNMGVKCTISSDDPGIFGVKAENHDFYLATIGARLTLQELKYLIHTSVFYSETTQEEKNKLWNYTEQKWNQFVEWFLQTYDKESHLNQLHSIIDGKMGKLFP